MLHQNFRRGTAAVEYVLVVALIIGVVLLGISTLGEHAAQSTATIAKLTNVHNPGQAADQPASERGGSESAVAAASGPTRLHWAGHMVQLVLACGLVVGIALQSYLSCRKVRQRAVEAEGSPEKQPHPLEMLFEKRQTILNDLAHVIGSQHLSELTVGQVMSSNLTVVARNASAREIEHILHSQRRHHILVTGDNQQLSGIISDRDLSRRTGDNAAELMTTKVTSATTNTELIVAATTMINQGISALPVVDDGKLVGILTTTDLTLVLQSILLLAKREQAATSDLVRSLNEA